jgi:hypothetical protein
MRVLILAIPIVVGLFTFTTISQVFADSLQGANKQRIGNYDVEMTTEPKTPISGSPTRILIRIAGVDGNDLVDVPIVIRIVKDSTELQRTTPIIVPYGHYTHGITFPQSGKYVLYVDLTDSNYTGQTLTFTFFINVAGPLDYLIVLVPLGAVIVMGIVGSMILIRKKKRKQTGSTELKE